MAAAARWSAAQPNPSQQQQRHSTRQSTRQSAGDGSLVSLLRLDGARSMMGAQELDRFVDLAARRLNTALSLPGHVFHVAFERAPDESGPLAEAHADAARRQGERLGLRLDDLLAERARRIAPLIAAETLVLACWTRPSVLPRDRLERDRRRLRKRLRDWLPDAGAAQCPHLALDDLWPRHEALLDSLDAVLAETGIVGARLGEDDALRVMRRMVNGTASTAPGWRPVTTSPADVALRNRVYALLPPALARAALARAFPAGTARGRIESEIARLDAPGAGRAASEEAVLDRLADEIARAAAQEPSETSESLLPVQDGPA